MAARARLAHAGTAFFNGVVTHVPSHTVRLGFLRLLGARIGAGSTLGLGTTLLEPARLRVGRDCSIGFRCMLDARGGIDIDHDVVIASDTHVITGSHVVDSDSFEAEFLPVRVGHHAWIASRSTVVGGVTIGDGAVVGACSLVREDVDERVVVAGVPARPRGVRTSSLAYSGRYRRRFQ